MLKTVGFPSTRTGDQTIVNGNLVIGTAGKGIDFSADPSASGMTSELFDDYEEGTWTPAGNVITFTSASGTYTKVGNLVTVNFVVIFPTTADVNNAQITGLPFTTGGVAAVALAGYNSDLNAQANASATLIYFANSTGTVFKTNANLSAQYISGFATYRV
jgi:hypothetical protein